MALDEIFAEQPVGLLEVEATDLAYERTLEAGSSLLLGYQGLVAFPDAVLPVQKAPLWDFVLIVLRNRREGMSCPHSRPQLLGDAGQILALVVVAVPNFRSRTYRLDSCRRPGK